MKKIQYNGSSKILNGIVTKVNLIIDKLVVDVKVNGTSVVVVNEEGEREADIDLSLADQNVKQSPTTSSDNSDYRVLLSKSANDTEETDISRKDTNLKYNPSTGNLQTTKLNGNTVPSGSGNDTLAKTSDIPDLSNYVQKSLTVGLIKNDGTIDQTQYATMSDIPDELADLQDDENHRLVTDTEKSTWNDKRAVNLELYTEDLNDVKTVGFYVGKISNTCTNKPSGVNQFGLYVVKLGTSNQYFKQILIQPLTVANGGSKTYSRALYQTTWTDWVEEKYTDEKVKQSAISDNSDHPILLSKSANTTEEIDGTYKADYLTYNRLDKSIRIGEYISRYGIYNGWIYCGYYHAIEAQFGTVNYAGELSIFNSNGGKCIIDANPSLGAMEYAEVYLPSANGTLALQSESVLWSHNNLLGAKNLIPINTTEKSHTQNNVQFTLNEDGSIKAHITGTGSGGTFDVTTKADENLILPNGTYIFSGCPSGGSNSTYRCRVRVYNITTGTETSYGFDTGSGVTVTVNETEGKGIIEIACFIYSGYNGSDLLFKPMIRPSSIADDTYTPPSQTNRQLTIDKAEITDLEDAYTDVYNLLHQPYYDQIQNKRVYRGVTFDINKDSIRVSGTASTSNPYYVFRSWQDGYCPNKNEVYHLEGCPSGGSTNSYYLVCQFVNSSGTTISYAYDFGNGVDFVLPDGTAFIGIIFYVKANYAISGTLTITPRLTVARKFPTYQIGTIENGANASRAYAKNELMIWLGDLYRVTTAISSGGAISGKVTATTLSAEIKAIRDALNI